MEYSLLTRLNKTELYSVKNAICQGKNGQQLSTLSQNFDLMIPKQSNQPIFAVASQNNVPIFVYSIHKEHKLTRGLSTVYHTQRIFQLANSGSKKLDQERKKFEQWLVNSLKDGYKILGLNCGEGVFTPHQKYMDVTQKFKSSM